VEPETNKGTLMRTLTLFTYCHHIPIILHMLINTQYYINKAKEVVTIKEAGTIPCKPYI
jgi:hypothetical protein